MASNPRFGDVVLLLPCDGADSSTTFTDRSLHAHAVTAFGNAKISTAQSKFGGASGLFDGSGDYLSVANSPVFALGSQDFCIEFFLRMAAIPAAGGFVALVAKRYSVSVSNAFTLWYSGTDKFYFSYTTNGSTQINTATLNATVPVVGQWYHVALSRHDGVIKLRLDGVAGGGAHSIGDASIYGGIEPVTVGACNYLTNYYLNGNIDDLQITVGSPVYTEDFTPPTGPHPTSGPSFSGIVSDADGEPAARLIRAMREDTGALVGETTSDGATGAYTITLPYGGKHTLVAYPGVGENLPALALRGVEPV